MKRGKIIMVLMWHPIGKRIPKGWRITEHRPSYHNRYSVLLEKIA